MKKKQDFSVMQGVGGVKFCETEEEIEKCLKLLPTTTVPTKAISKDIEEFLLCDSQGPDIIIAL